MASAISLTADQKKKIVADQKAYVKKNFDLNIWANQISVLYNNLEKNRGSIEQSYQEDEMKAYA